LEENKYRKHFLFVSIVLYRAGIWKPQVTPLAEPVHVPTGESLLTKTSLALHHEVICFGRKIEK
jgi:hypothetical protein